MKYKILLAVLVLIGVAVACNKDKFQTKPQLFLKNINRSSVPRGELLTMNLEFTDAEGDVQDTLWIQRISKVCPAQIGVQFKSGYKIPDFSSTKNQKGTFEINFVNGILKDGFVTINTCSSKTDTSYFKFWMKDKAKNVSDTVTTSNIAIEK